MSAGIATVIGSRADHFELRDFLTRTAQSFEWFEAGSTAGTAILAAHHLNLDLEPLPVMIDGDSVIAPATVENVKRAWGLRTSPSRAVYDTVIVGAGPAGLSAAVYAASDGMRTLVLDMSVPGGQAAHTSQIENFFGFPRGIGGAELTARALEQAEGFGAEIVTFAKPCAVVVDEEGRFVLTGDSGKTITSDILIGATGMEWRKLDAPGIEEFLGHGVHYGAGRGEAAHCGGDRVVVVGAGNSAGQAAMHLANSGAEVVQMVRGGSLDSMSYYLSERILNHPRVDVRFQCEIEKVDGDASVETVTDNHGQVFPVEAVFLCLGGVPRSDWAHGLNPQCEKGFLRTGPDLLNPEGNACAIEPVGWTADRAPLALETSVPRFFAAGDVRFGSPRRVGGAVGDGAMAVALAHRATE